MHIIDEVYWKLGPYYIAAWSFNNIDFFLFLRCFGIALISFQRYLVICKDGSYIKEKISFASKWSIFLFHWLIPAVISSSTIANTNIQFDNIHTLNVILAPEDLSRSNFISNIFVLLTFIITISSYVSVLTMVINNRSQINNKIRREVKLYVQVAGLVIMFIFMSIYYMLQLIFSLSSNESIIFTMRFYYPVLTSCLSYINPWMIIFLNKDIYHSIREILLGPKLTTAVLSKGYDIHYMFIIGLVL
uniref:G_PROTEIN_RECEP_F1_2 domain-containing protein n=1 Tax=Heterorhabditis bacteriophora TaxID=37862 RepID=A0A1I7WCT1_HETBA